MSRSVSQSEPGASVARRRLLDTATRLFYAEGIRAVGIDRIIAQAGVAKATFYNHFPSKDDLVLAYVEEQDRLGREAVAALPKQPPRKMIAAIMGRIMDDSGFYDAKQAKQLMTSPEFRGGMEYQIKFFMEQGTMKSAPDIDKAIVTDLL